MASGLGSVEKIRAGGTSSDRAAACRGAESAHAPGPHEPNRNMAMSWVSLSLLVQRYNGRRDSEIAVVLRPPTQAAGRTEARCCFLVRGETWRSWPLAAEPSGQSFRFTGRLGSGLEPGEWRLWAVVGRPGSLPGDAALPARLRQTVEPHPGWQAMAKELIVE